MLEGQNASGGAISQALTLPFSMPSSRVTAPIGGLAFDVTAAPDQQTAYNNFVAAASPLYPEYGTYGVAFEDVRILAISSAVYQPFQTTVSLYENGNFIGDFASTDSLANHWSGYLNSAIAQVPEEDWTVHLIGKPPNQQEDFTYYKNVLLGKVATSMTNYSNQNATLSNSNLLDAMSHLDGNPNVTQYVADPAARSNLYGIFQKVQLHVQHVATGVPETL